MEQKKLLEVRNLVVEYETDDATVHAVNGIDIDLNMEQTLGLVGETGAGKTTTAMTIMNLLPELTGRIRSGSVMLDDKDLLHMSDAELDELRGKDMAMIFQDPMTALNPVYTIGEQIAEALMLHGEADKETAPQKAGEMLELVGIPASRKDDYPHQLSGGMKQRVVIAIGLACNPKLLIADEPTTALDVTVQAQILEIMVGLKEKFKTSMILITHDLGIVAEVCDIVSVLYAGHIVEYGTLADVYENTKHPYTEGLFNSLPDLDSPRERLEPIPGLMPDPSVVPEGCPFAPRCKYATDHCLEKMPEKRWINDTHYVLCSAYDDPSFHIERRLTFDE